MLSPTYLFFLVSTAAMLWVFYDLAVEQKSMSVKKKLVWVVLAIVFGIVAAPTYYLLEKR